MDRPEFFFVELKIDNTTSINGELSIMDFIATQKNRNTSTSNMNLFLQGCASSLAFDDWASVLNRRLRPAMNSFTITKDGADVKETIKAVAKALED